MTEPNFLLVTNGESSSTTKEVRWDEASFLIRFLFCCSFHYYKGRFEGGIRRWGGSGKG